MASMEASLCFTLLNTQLRGLGDSEKMLYSLQSYNFLKLNRHIYISVKAQHESSHFSVCPGLSQCVEAFDVVLKGPLSEYLNNSRAIGSEVEKQVSCV